MVGVVFVDDLFGVLLYIYIYLDSSRCGAIPSLKLTAKAPENGWLEY